MAGSIYAKTGTLSNNPGPESGFLITRKGTLLTFSIMVNNYRGPARPIRQKLRRDVEGNLAKNLTPLKHPG